MSFIPPLFGKFRILLEMICVSDKAQSATEKIHYDVIRKAKKGTK